MQSPPSGVKRERDADESKDTGKQPKVVKEEQPGETKMPKIEGQVDEPRSKPNVSVRRLNLMAGRLPGHNPDNSMLNWPTFGEGGEYYISASGTVELCVVPTQAVKAEPRVIKPSFVPVYTPVGGNGATVEIYNTLRLVLEKMISFPDGRAEGKVNSCPFRPGGHPRDRG